MSRNRVVLVCALIVSGIGACWVALAAEPPKPVTVQAVLAAEAAVGEKPVVVAIGEPTELERALEKPAKLKFTDEPLKDVAAAIAKQFGINVVLASKSLAEAGVSEDTPIRCDLPQLPLHSALRSMLQGHDLNYTTADNVLTITTADSGNSTTIVRLYNVRELANPLGDFDKPGDQWREILGVLHNTVAPQSWDEAGGAGSVRCQDGILIVSQILEVQEQIEDLLTCLVRLRRAPHGADVQRLGDSLQPPLAKRLNEIQDVHFTGGGLKDIVSWLRSQGVPAELDTKALAETGIGNVSLHSLNAHHVTLRWILQHLLGEADLTFLIDHDILLITTSDKAKGSVVSFLFPIGDLIDAAAESSGADEEAAFEGLSTTIRSTIASNSWDESGGAGSLMLFAPARVLICSQTFEVQRSVENLLSDLRAAYKAARTVMPADEPVKQLAIVIFYPLSPASEKSRTIANVAPAEQYAALLRSTVEPKMWADGGASIAVVPNGLVVRATPTMQTRIGRVLQYVGAVAVAQQPTGPSGSPNPTGSASSTGITEPASPAIGTPTPTPPANTTPAPAGPAAKTPPTSGTAPPAPPKNSPSEIDPFAVASGQRLQLTAVVAQLRGI